MRVLFLLLVSGCAAVPVPLFDEREVTLRIVDQFADPRQKGEARCTEERCVLTIRRDMYPNCFLHEIRHAFEGDWHMGPSGGYCR